MAHSAMYQLQQELRQQVYDLNNEAHGHKYQAGLAEHKRDHKQKQLDVLTEQLENVLKYEAEQRELAAEEKS